MMFMVVKMDNQKEREAFEKALVDRCGFNPESSFSVDDKGEYRSDATHFAWSMWQAAKAQAVPEGFVLVPKEPTDAMLFAASGRDIVAEHYGGENILWPELRETWKAMIEAQEQSND